MKEKVSRKPVVNTLVWVANFPGQTSLAADSMYTWTNDKGYWKILMPARLDAQKLATYVDYKGKVVVGLFGSHTEGTRIGFQDLPWDK